MLHSVRALSGSHHVCSCDLLSVIYFASDESARSLAFGRKQSFFGVSIKLEPVTVILVSFIMCLLALISALGESQFNLLSGSPHPSLTSLMPDVEPRVLDHRVAVGCDAQWPSALSPRTRRRRR